MSLERFHRRMHHRLAAWLTMVAMVMGALAPAMAQAVVAGSGSGNWVEVCSASGMVWVKADTDRADHKSGGPMADAGMNCPWCSLHGGAAGLPPQAQKALLPAGSALLLPQGAYASAQSLVWAGAHARAPPLAS